ncbi:MAG: cell division protein [Planctomycetaceae bacterium]
MPFTGTYIRSLDEKLRLSIPGKFREELGDAPLFLGPETDQSLGLYSRRMFEQRASKLADVSGSPGHVRNYMRLYYSQAEQVEPDSQGRIRIPERLTSFARLGGEVVLLGVHDHVEVWDKGQWDEFLASHGPEFDRLAGEAFLK